VTLALALGLTPAEGLAKTTSASVGPLPTISVGAAAAAKSRTASPSRAETKAVTRHLPTISVGAAAAAKSRTVAPRRVEAKADARPVAPRLPTPSVGAAAAPRKPTTNQPTNAAWAEKLGPAWLRLPPADRASLTRTPAVSKPAPRRPAFVPIGRLTALTAQARQDRRQAEANAAFHRAQADAQRVLRRTRTPTWSQVEARLRRVQTSQAVGVPPAQAQSSWQWSGSFCNQQCNTWKPVIHPPVEWLSNPVLSKLSVAIEQKVCTKDRVRQRIENQQGRRVKHVQVLRYTDVYGREVDSINIGHPLVYHGKGERVPGLSGPGTVIQDYFVPQ
jgi:hypothetical protein